MLQTATEVRSGQFLSQSDLQSVKAGFTDCMKKESHFKWTEAAQKSFDALKKRIVKAPVLARILKSSLKWSPIDVKASGLAIGAEEGKPIAFFSEKLNEARKSLSSSDKDRRCMHWCLKHWRHYQLPKEFVVYTDHQARSFLQTQDKLSARHARWVAYLQSLTF